MQRDAESAGPSSTLVVTVVAVILGRNSLDFTVDVLGDEVTERVGHGPGMRTGVLAEVRARGDGAGDQVAEARFVERYVGDGGALQRGDRSLPFFSRDQP
ncbi:hypothetical protein [Streptomyces rubiginosohelvolus]|uniref:hypothetical protein n=1 Tax=Streptomyces rubiginosohelvolus TaxID=67362 RepID=UPI0035DF5DE5